MRRENQRKRKKAISRARARSRIGYKRWLGRRERWTSVGRWRARPEEHVPLLLTNAAYGKFAVGGAS